MEMWRKESCGTRRLIMIKDTLKMFWYYSKTSLNSRLQYKVDAILTAIALFFTQITEVVAIYFMLKKFHNINGWNLNELLFLFSILFLTYGIFIIFFAGLRDFRYRIIDGAFDRMIIRPRGVLFQLISVNSDWLAAFGYGGLGLMLLIITANNVNMVWNIQNILYYVLVIINGVLIQGAMYLFFSSLRFFFVEVDNLINLTFYNMRDFAKYPISIFNKGIQFILMYIVPFAFLNYFPCEYLLRKADMAQYPEVYMYIAPFVGVVMYVLAYLFWRFSLKYYKSTGN